MKISTRLVRPADGVRSPIPNRQAGWTGRRGSNERAEEWNQPLGILTLVLWTPLRAFGRYLARFSFRETCLNSRLFAWLHPRSRFQEPSFRPPGSPARGEALRVKPMNLPCERDRFPDVSRAT